MVVLRKHVLILFWLHLQGCVLQPFYCNLFVSVFQWLIEEVAEVAYIYVVGLATPTYIQLERTAKMPKVAET